jgi:hypothetical protein
MRSVLLAGLVLLGGCGLSPQWNEWARQRSIKAHDRELTETYRRLAENNDPERDARLSCETKVAFAMAGAPIRGSLDVAGVVRQQQLQAACMEHWRRTGQFP